MKLDNQVSCEMPKSRKRHHSRSRSRSRSHSQERREEKHRKIDSHEKDRDGKRRKIDSVDSPHKRSVSSPPETTNQILPDILEDLEQKNTPVPIGDHVQEKAVDTSCSQTKLTPDIKELTEPNAIISHDISTSDVEQDDITEEVNKKNENITIILDSPENDHSTSSSDPKSIVKDASLANKLILTPKRTLSPKQLQKRLESEKKRKEKQIEREEKERKINEEKDRIKQEKLKQKQEKHEQRQKLLEEKQKQLEEKQKQKDLRKKEKEEREEQKRKEKEQEKMKRQQEIDEKNKEKLKLEEQKQKVAAAFVNFFVAKKSDNEDKKGDEQRLTSNFMPFEVKSDMRLPPPRRPCLTDKEKQHLTDILNNQDQVVSYLSDIKQNGKSVGKSAKTWPFDGSIDSDVMIVEEEGDLGETICEDGEKIKKLRAKYLKFHENRRPAYRGTWRKKSKCINPRQPFSEDKDIFDYEVDSDDDWEEEEQGESLENGSDEDDKENEVENEDYEVDNEFFVPHGHLSDDEIDDEQNSKISPEALKQKLKLLKDEFDMDMQSKTHKIKPRSIGCIWYNQNGDNVEEAIDRYLQPLAIIVRAPINIKDRNELLKSSLVKKKQIQELHSDHIPMFLKLVHGNVNKTRAVVEQFLTYLINKGFNADVGKLGLGKTLKQVATWKKCTEDGVMKNKHCWIVNEDVMEKHNIILSLPNQWEH